MSITHNLIRGWSSGSDTISERFAVVSGAEHNIDEAIPLGTDTLVAYALDVSQLKSIFIVSDKAMTIETNSGSAAANTITLAANVPFLWAFGDAPLRDTAGVAITVDITALYVTNAANAQLQIRALLDPTV
jgi:hypothetical protein